MNIRTALALLAVTHATAMQAVKFIMTETPPTDTRKDWEKTRDASS